MGGEGAGQSVGACWAAADSQGGYAGAGRRGGMGRGGKCGEGMADIRAGEWLTEGWTVATVGAARVSSRTQESPCMTNCLKPRPLPPPQSGRPPLQQSSSSKPQRTTEEHL